MGPEGRHAVLQAGDLSSIQAHTFRSKGAQTTVSTRTRTHTDIPSLGANPAPQRGREQDPVGASHRVSSLGEVGLCVFIVRFLKVKFQYYRLFPM